MSAYDNDLRVTPRQSGCFHVELEGVAGRRGSQDGYVIQLSDGYFEVRVGSPDAIGRPFDTADEAIRSLIGEPR